MERLALTLQRAASEGLPRDLNRAIAKKLTRRCLVEVRIDRMQRVPRFFLSAIVASSTLLVSPVSAQQADAAASGTSQLATSNDRLFNLLPNFLTLEDAGQRPALTTGQKFNVVARGSFDYVIFPWYGLLAGISQAQNSEAGYGHGAAGYGKRYGAAFADSTIEGFMTGAILPSLLRQDPRFYQSSNGRFFHRLGYAVSRIAITRSDSGGEQFNYSEIFGSAIAAGISTYSYHPHSDRTLSNTVAVWGSQVGYDTISTVIKEFWPDIRKKLHHKAAAEAEKP
jgi:hypothetical protein